MKRWSTLLRCQHPTRVLLACFLLHFRAKYGVVGDVVKVLMRTTDVITMCLKASPVSKTLGTRLPHIRQPSLAHHG